MHIVRDGKEWSSYQITMHHIPYTMHILQHPNDGQDKQDVGQFEGREQRER